MTNLANLPPMGLKHPKPPKPRRKALPRVSKRRAAYLASDDRKAGLAHMAAVAELPCVCCGARPVTVHHVICGRYSQRKAPDTATIPLCHLHHQGADGIHTRREWWVQTYGPDTDYLPVVADMLAGELVYPWKR